ncbi:MAG: tRNA dihydrouridine synthase DusB [Pseudomonadota bacterium]
MPVSGALAPLDPPIALAPLAGITDLPFRNLVSRFGAGLVVSEMVASQEMVQAKPGVRERAELGCEVSKTAVQLAGRDPYWMGEAARHITDQGAAVIDINMGCPAKKVTNGLSGSALMRDLDHALRLIEATVAATHLPVTLKTRLGWDDDTLNAADLARRAEAAGVQRIVIHGRTRCQFYKGRANWHAIAAVTEAVSIPVLANGDILDGATATAAMDASGAAGVMVGRGAQGRPWLLAQIASELWGHKAPSVPQGADRADLVAGHYEDILSFYGIELGVRVARKHLGWYLEDSPCTPELRRHVLTERDPKAVLQRLKDAFPAVEYRGAAA